MPSQTGPAAAGRRRLVSPALVGRERELALLLDAVSTPPTVVTIEGEAGIGKTRLVNELRQRLGDQGGWYLAGCCRQIREPFPLGPVIEALRGQHPALGRVPLSPVAGALAPLLPELTVLLPPPPPPLADRAAERHRVFRALVEVLKAASRTILVLEDLHWADSQTIDFLNYLLADPPPELSVVLTFRSAEVLPAVRLAAADLAPAVSRAELVLSPLDEPATGALAAAILGGGRVATELSGYLHEQTAGVPFAVEEVLALLRTRGALTRQGGSWSRRTNTIGEVPIGIRDAIRERVSHLSAEAISVLEAASVLQPPVAVALLSRTSSVPPQRVLPVLAELLDSGLLVADREQVRFRHLLAAHAVYKAISAPRRRLLHRRAAANLPRTYPDRRGELAHHLRHAGMVRQWVITAEQAADRATELGNDEGAARLLEEVLRHATLDADQRGRLAVKLARAAVETIHARDAERLLLTLPTADLPAAVRGELRFWLSVLVQHTGGDPQQQRRLLADAVGELDRLPDLQAMAMAAMGVPAGAPEVPLAEHLRWLHRALEVLPRMSTPALRVLVLGKIAMVRAVVGDPAWRQQVDQIRHRTGGRPTGRREVSAYDSVAIEACYAGHHQAAYHLLTAAQAGALRCHSRRLELRSRAWLALVDYCRGEWAGLRERAELLIDELTDYVDARLDVEAVAGCLALAGGDLATARRRLVEVVRQLGDTERLSLVPLPVAALLRLATSRGDPAPALATAEPLIIAAERKGILPPLTRVLPALTQATVTAGDLPGATNLVRRYAARLTGLDAPLAGAALSDAEGFLGAGAQRWRPAAASFLAAAERYQAAGCPYEALQAREQAAGCLFEAGDRRAGEALTAALAGFQELPASWDAARAARAARRHGLPLTGRYRGGRRGYGDQLSPRESEVARLAATGLTNREIAGDLFLSRKTVDKHLSAALRKLGLDSRRALVHHLREPAGGDG